MLTAVVGGAPARVDAGALNVPDNSTLFWRERGAATDCAAATPDSALGGVQTVEGGEALFDMGRPGPVFLLCVQLPGADGPTPLPAELSVYEVVGADRAHVVERVATVVTFSVEPAPEAGDEAGWADASAADCSSLLIGLQRVAEDGSATFETSGVALGLRLCYRHAAASSVQLYPALTLDVFGLSGLSLSPGAVSGGVAVLGFGSATTFGFNGTGVADGDAVRLVAAPEYGAADVDCDEPAHVLSAADATVVGGQAVLTPELPLVDGAIPAGIEIGVVCYRFGPSGSFVAYDAFHGGAEVAEAIPQLRPVVVTGPSLVVGVLGVEKTISLQGVNAQLLTDVPASWADAEDTACESAPSVTFGGELSAQGGALSFTALSTTAGGARRLCATVFGTVTLSLPVLLEVNDVSGPADTRALVGSQVNVTFDGHGVGAGDLAFWSAADADCSTVDSDYGGVSAVGTDGRAAFLGAEGGEALALCYAFVDPAVRGHNPYKRYPALTLDFQLVTSPVLSFLVVGVAETVRFGGYGLRDGDEAKWLPKPAEGGVDCASLGGAEALVGGNATFTAADTARGDEYVLCFNHGGAGFRPYESLRLRLAGLVGPAAHVAVAGAVERITPPSESLLVLGGNKGYWAAAGTTECTGVADADFGGEWTVQQSAAGNVFADYTPLVSASGLVLCFQFSGVSLSPLGADGTAVISAPEPYKLYTDITLDVYGLESTQLNAQAVVRADYTTVAFSGLGVSSADTAFWVAASTASCAAGARLRFGGLQQLNGNLQATFNFKQGGLGFKLCYTFAGEPARLYSGITLDVYAVTGPAVSIAIDQEPQTITFAGPGVGAGDQAYWQFATPSTACFGEPNPLVMSAPLTVGARGEVNATFTLPEPTSEFLAGFGGLVLCYRFGADAAQAWTRFPASTVSVTYADDPFSRASFSSVVPTGAAYGVETSVTILGSGFGLAIDSFDVVKCVFDGVRTAAVSITATAIVCLTPARSSAELSVEEVAMQIVAEVPDLGLQPLGVISDFAYYDASAALLSAISPAGAPQGTTGREVALSGSGLSDFGRVRVRFGGSSIVSADLIEGEEEGEIRCEAPYVSPTATPRALSVEVSLNGQTYVESTLTFESYSAIIASGTPTGGPLGGSTVVTLTGTGFVPGLSDDAVCFFVSAAGESIESSATIVSDEQAECAKPLVAAGAYTVELALNGIDRVPTFFDDVDFEVYDIESVAVARLEPPGGPVAGGTRVTVFGTGFKVFGPDQFCCVFGGSGACDAAATLLQNDPLTGASRARCVTPAVSAGASSVEVSLNGGGAASTTDSAVRFWYYARPVLDAIVPDEGLGDGGEPTLITGSGFRALADAPIEHAGAALASYVRVRFGPTYDEPPSELNATGIAQLSTWGAQGVANVTVALNGQQYDSLGSVPFLFKELHTPALVFVGFDSTATQLVVQFDEQPTNRGGMSGVDLCSLVLTDSTVAEIRGGSSDEPECFWVDDSTMRANLNFQTSLRPGSTIGLRDRVVAPRDWRVAGTSDPCSATDASPYYCTLSESMAIDFDEPCVGGCPVPVADISGVSQISFCPGESFSLDGRLSSNGGIVPLRFTWRVVSNLTDFPSQITAKLAPFNAANGGAGSSTITLSDLPGESYVFALRVNSFLGISSPVTRWPLVRTGGASPTIVIDGASEQRVLPSSAVSVQAAATVAACFEGSSNQIDFLWANDLTLVTATSAASSARVNITNPTKSAIAFSRFTFTPGLTYQLTLTASMPGFSDATTTASVRLVVERVDLQAVISGGARTVGQGNPVVVDASASFDPNVPLAESAAGLQFAWAVRRLNGTLSTAFDLGALATNESVLTLPGGTLAAGPDGSSTYEASLELSKPSASLRASASVLITVVVDSVPVITFVPLTQAKYNPRFTLATERLNVEASVAPAPGSEVPDGGWLYSWRAFTIVAGSPVAAPAVLEKTTTGTSLPRIAFASAALQAGATYQFELEVSGGTATAAGSVTVVMNRPPFGGSLAVAPRNGTATETLFTLTSDFWSDDDLPLEYLFGYLTSADVAAGSDAQSLGPRAKSTSIQADLPTGELTATVFVYDIFNGRTEARDGPISVLEPTVVDQAKVNEVAQRARNANAAGQGAQASQAITALASSASAPGGRRRLNEGGLSAESINELLELTRAATGVAIDSVEQRDVAAGTITAVVCAAGDASLDADGQAATFEQLRGLVSGGATSTGLSAKSLDNFITAFSVGLSARNANLTNVTDAQAELVNALVNAARSSSANVLAVGKLAEEEATEKTSSEFNVSVAVRDPAAVTNSTVSVPGSSAAVGVPTGFGDSLGGADTAGGVTFAVSTQSQNTYTDPATQTVSGQTGDAGNGPGVLGPQQSNLLSVEVGSVGSGAGITVSGLATPLLLTLDRQGDAPVECRFFNESTSEWATDGCRTVLPPGDSRLTVGFSEVLHALPTDALVPAGADFDAKVYCLCTHLTTFAIYSAPSSTEELEDEVSAIANKPVNTFNEDDIEAAFQGSPEEIFRRNETMVVLLSIMIGLMFITVAFAAYVDNRAWTKMQKRMNEENIEDRKRRTALADRVEAQLDHLDDEIDAAMDRAAKVIRQQFGFKRTATLEQAGGPDTRAELEQAMRDRRKREHVMTKLIRLVSGEIGSNHTILSLCFGDPENQRRAEVVQIFWSILFMELLVEIMLYSGPADAVDDCGALLVSGQGGQFGGGIIGLIWTAIVTSVLCGPYLYIMVKLYDYANGRTGPVLDRLFYALRQHIESELEEQGDSDKIAPVFGRRTSVSADDLDRSSRRYTSGDRLSVGPAAGGEGSEVGTPVVPSSGGAGQIVPVPTDAAGQAGRPSPPSAGRGAVEPPPAPPEPTPPGLAVVTSSGDIEQQRSGRPPPPTGEPPMSPMPMSPAPGPGGVRLSKETVFHLRAIFDRYDLGDGQQDGVISTFSLGRMVRHFCHKSTQPEDQDEMLANIRGLDTDESGAITFTEFRVWYRENLVNALEREKLRSQGWRKVWFCLTNLRISPLRKQIAAWVIIWILVAGTCFITFIFGTVLGDAAVCRMLVAWVMACISTFTLEVRESGARRVRGGAVRGRARLLRMCASLTVVHVATPAVPPRRRRARARAQEPGMITWDTISPFLFAWVKVSILGCAVASVVDTGASGAASGATAASRAEEGQASAAKPTSVKPPNQPPGAGATGSGPTTQPAE